MSKWKYIILATIVLLAGTLGAIAQEPTSSKVLTISIPCTDSTNAIETFRKVDERLYFIADTLIKEATQNRMYKAGIYLWMNLDTGTGSFAIMFPDLTMCLLAPGQNIKAYTGGQPWDAPKGKGS